MSLHDPQQLWKGEHLIRAPKREPEPVPEPVNVNPQSRAPDLMAARDQADVARIKPLAAQGYSQSEIGRMLDLNCSRIHRLCKRFNLHIEDMRLRETRARK